MVANKRTRKEVITLCDEIIDLLTNFNIENKDEKKKVENIIKKANNSKDLIDNKKNGNKHNITGYNNFIKDCYNIKKEEQTSGLLTSSIEKEILNKIKNNKDEHIFTVFGNTWKNLDKDIKNKYNVDSEKKTIKK